LIDDKDELAFKQLLINSPLTHLQAESKRKMAWIEIDRPIYLRKKDPNL